VNGGASNRNLRLDGTKLATADQSPGATSAAVQTPSSPAYSELPLFPSVENPAAQPGGDMMQNILHLTLRREPFAAIAAKRKHVEYRDQKPYWRKRLEGRNYDVIKFRNGYSIKAPEMLVEFRGLSFIESLRSRDRRSPGSCLAADPSVASDAATPCVNSWTKSDTPVSVTD
jgi:hypothetical protein